MRATELDRRMMRRVLALAALGRGSTSPNPLVGAVVARGERVVAQAFHRRAGEAHAEVLALEAAGALARGATLYTNLEPCCHTGRTPPCVDEVLRAGIARVVAAHRDPDPRVDGKGFRALRRAGVAVEVGLLRDEALRLNEAFVMLKTEARPFVTIKAAASLDGRIATRRGDARWVSSAEARAHAGRLRQEHDAILVGIGTVLADDPRLTLRPHPRGHRWLRIVADTHLRLPLDSRLVATARRMPVLVAAGRNASAARAARLAARGVEVLPLPVRRGRVDLRALLRRLGERSVSRLLVEGGGEIHASLVEDGLADRLVVYLAPRLVGGRGAPGVVGGRGAARIAETVRLRNVHAFRVGAETVVEADLPRRRRAAGR